MFIPLPDSTLGVGELPALSSGKAGRLTTTDASSGYCLGDF